MINQKAFLLNSSSPNLRTKTLLLVLLSIFFYGCASKPWSHCDDKSCELDVIKDIGYEKAEKVGHIDDFYELRNLCDDFYELYRYSDAEHCLIRLETRVDNLPYMKLGRYHKDVSAFDRTDYYRQNAEASIRSAQLYLDYHDCNKSLGYATKGLNPFQNSYPPTMEDEYRELRRLKGLSAACLGNTSAAEQEIGYIRGISLGVLNRTDDDVKNKLAIADVYQALGKYGQAENELRRSNAWSMTDFLMVGASIYAAGAAGPNSIPALDYLQAVNQATQSGELPKDKEIPHLYKLARSYLARDFYNSSVGMYERLFSRDDLKSKFPDVYYAALGDYALSLRNADQSDKAKEYFIKAIDFYERNRNFINASSSKIGYMSDKFEVYSAYIDYLIEIGDHGKALEYAERSKSRALVDSLAAKEKFGSRSSKADSLINEIKILEENSFNKSEDERSMILSLRSELKAEAPELLSLISVPSINIADMQSTVPDNTSMLFFSQSVKGLNVFALNKDSVYGHMVELANIDTLVEEYLEKIRTRSDDYLSNSRALYDALIKPVEPHLNGTSLLITPYGKLHYLPFGSLHDGQSFLVEKYSYSLMPNISIIELLSNRVVQSEKALVIGNPANDHGFSSLEMSELEASAIGNLTYRSKTLKGEQATETEFKNSISDYGVIHYAGHAYFNENEPLLSSLVMAGDDKNDGMFTLSELYETNISADLVTLSACETGLGEVRSGDEVFGFTHGLLFSGANSVVSSLWKVPDEETGLLMLGFYSNLESMSKSEALQQAKVFLLNDINPHPYYWSSFEYTGLN
ncbi:CHAT domain-containing protein [Oleiphilus sp. HI0086]|uniref:CHAT domain-containing protein n=1 Tax=Oleiphilus sp. HI0086 TaxID=1822260 RepID=UPI0007C2112F|nr:CHAT domain-containing protein [Oleiphilus sp. HI0086]KZY41958.1 hypothetical protein A3732_17285 [Oleiphilus sp. HI0050]KZZ35599.1 hypothetical protein A3756_02300 [Oleiphilus sp. HI0086]